jgi:hypothetical protein
MTTRSLAIYPADVFVQQDKATFRFREFKVDRLDWETPVAEEDFAVTVPNGYQIQLAGDDWALVVDRKGVGTGALKLDNRLVSHKDLPALLKELEASAQYWKWVASKASPKAAPQPETSPSNSKTPPAEKAAEDATKLPYVDLQPKANQKLAGSFGSGIQGNNLGTLPRGEQIFAGVKFMVSDGLLQLGRKEPPLKEPRPDRVEGIKVNKAFWKLHLLHGTVGGAYKPQQFVNDGTKIAEYKVHYEDGTTEVIPVIYGQDLRDFFNHDDSSPVTRGKVAWRGENDYTQGSGKQLIRVYLSTWENPQPTKSVASIDFVKVGDTPAAPFCVAMTLEDK